MTSYIVIGQCKLNVVKTFAIDAYGTSYINTRSIFNPISHSINFSVCSIEKGIFISARLVEAKTNTFSSISTEYLTAFAKSYFVYPVPGGPQNT